MADPLQHALGAQRLADDRTVDERRCIWLGDCLSVIASVTTALLLATLPGCGENRHTPPKSLDDWIAHHQRLEETVWADEFLAQRYEKTLVALWDALLHADRKGSSGAKSKILASIDFDTLTIGTLHQIETLDHGIAVFEPKPPHLSLIHI